MKSKSEERLAGHDDQNVKNHENGPHGLEWQPTLIWKNPRLTGHCHYNIAISVGKSCVWCFLWLFLFPSVLLVMLTQKGAICISTHCLLLVKLAPPTLIVNIHRFHISVLLRITSYMLSDCVPGSCSWPSPVIRHKEILSFHCCSQEKDNKINDILYRREKRFMF